MRFLHSFVRLSQRSLGFLSPFLHFRHKFSSGLVPNLSSRVVTFPWVLSVIENERGLLVSGVRGIIVGKLGDRKPILPVVLMEIDEYSKVLFDCLIHPFSLSISLRVVSSGGILFDSNESAKFREVFRNEACIAVVNDSSKPSMVSNNSIS